MSLYKVRLNFITQIEAISPTYTRTLDRGFRNVDRLLMGGDRNSRDTFGNSVGRARDFTVKRAAGDALDTESPTCQAEFISHHDYVLEVAMPTAIGLESDIHEAIETDRLQIIKALRAASTYDKTNTGLMARRYDGDELIDSGPVWIQRYAFRCMVREATT